MSFVNYHSKEINCKIVYFGPASSGKTTNLHYIYTKTNPEARSQMLSLNDEASERTLFFDFLPLALGTFRGFKIRFHLYTIPGHSQYEASRKLILRGVDGIIFVCDSQLTRMEENLESFAILEKSLEEQGYDIQRIPLVFQYNKRDLPNISPTSELAKAINRLGAPEFEAIANKGVGVFECLKELSKKILAELRGNETEKKIGGDNEKGNDRKI